MNLILPYHDFTVECTDCQFKCFVRIFNGVKAWQVGPSVDDMAKPNELVLVFKCTNETALGALRAVMDDGPHTSDYALIWAEDDRTYELLVKLSGNYDQLKAMEPDDDDEAEGEHHSKH